MKKIISWFTENHVAANLLMAFFLIAGFIYALNMKVEIFPEIALDTITISVAYPGASPEEVEEGIILPIEQAISGLSGIKNIDSSATEGHASIVIEALKSWDINKLYDDIKTEVDGLTSLPEKAEDPVIQRLTRKSQVLNIAIYGNVSPHVLKKYAQQIKDDLTALPQVSLVTLSGVKNNEIHVEVGIGTLRKYHLSFEDIAQKIALYSQDVPLGRIKAPSGELVLRMKAKRYTPQDFASIPILTSPDGQIITLGQIATIKDTFEDTDTEILFQGQPAALIHVFRIGDQNALTIAKAVRTYVAREQNNLPPDVHIQVYNDNSQLLKSRLNLLLKNMAYGLILVIIVLGVFLDINLAFWVTMGIPISFAGAIIFLPNVDVSINMISLFAFIMVLGIVVDDAIVIGENIYTKYQKGLPSFKACVEGATEISKPVIFSVLTTIAAFFPLLLGSGKMGKFMRNIPLVINLVLIVSLIEAILVLPCHINSSLKHKVQKSPKLISVWLQKFTNGIYAKLLDLCLRYRYVSLTVILSILILAFGLVKGGIIKFTFFPKVESDFLTCSVTLPPGTPVNYTKTIIKRIDRSLHEVIQQLDAKRPPNAPSLLKYTTSMVGFQMVPSEASMLTSQIGGNVGQVFAELLSNEQRQIKASYIVKLWRQKVGDIPGAEELSFSSDLFSFGAPIAIDLSHPNYKVLDLIAQKLEAKLKKIPGVFDVSDSFIPGKKEVYVTLKPKGLSLGVSPSYLANEIRAAFYGKEALSFQRNEDEVKVKVMLPEEEKNKLATLESLWIKTPSGEFIPLNKVANFKLAQGYATITRHNRQRIVTVFADVDETKANANEIRNFLKKQILPQLSKEYQGLHWSWSGEGQEKQESMRDLAQDFSLALLLIYILLAVPLKSYFQPLIIMLSIPFSILGAILGHLLLGFNLSIMSLFGIVGLAGVAVNDALVLIDAANMLRQRGQAPFEAAKLAGIKRFRAVILTSLTTFAGLTPMLMEKSLQAQFLIPMAISLGFGILLATFITLLIIPCGYVILFDLVNLKNKIFESS
ncbi:MAG: efflux RND transporter permease subunit [Desulfonauticus sp.]|nr:efflux RND transporter permease subunit [Desulfonauticus sp.]